MERCKYFYKKEVRLERSQVKILMRVELRCREKRVGSIVGVANLSFLSSFSVSSGEEFDSASRHLSLLWYRPCTVETVVPSMDCHTSWCF